MYQWQQQKRRKKREKCRVTCDPHAYKIECKRVKQTDRINSTNWTIEWKYESTKREGERESKCSEKIYVSNLIFVCSEKLIILLTAFYYRCCCCSYLSFMCISKCCRCCWFCCYFHRRTFHFIQAAFSNSNEGGGGTNITTTNSSSSSQCTRQYWMVALNMN